MWGGGNIWTRPGKANEMMENVKYIKGKIDAKDNSKKRR